MAKLPLFSKGCLFVLATFNQSILALCLAFLLDSYVEFIIKQFSHLLLFLYLSGKPCCLLDYTPPCCDKFLLRLLFFFLSLLFVGNTFFLPSFCISFLCMCVCVCCAGMFMCVHKIWSQRLTSGVLLGYSSL